MKHLMLILSAMLMPVMLFGQHKLIVNAMRNRHRGQFSQVQNTSMILLHEELQSYCKQNGYYLRGEAMSRYTNFNTVTYFEILPMDDVDEYIYNNKCKFTDKSAFDALSATGKGWVFLYGEGVSFDDIKWSGGVQNGLINGKGTGYCKKDQTYFFISGEFVDGFPKGKVVFGRYDYSDNFDKGHFLSYWIAFGEMSDGMAWVKREIDKKYGFVSVDGVYVVTNKYTIVSSFRNGRAEVLQDDKEIIIDKNCNFVGYTEEQQEIDAEQRRIEEERLAEQHRLEEERRRIEEEKRLAEQRRIQDSLDRIERARVEEERRRAEHERKITVNCNYKLWSKGDHICYVLPDGYYKGKLTCGTLEEWNENRSKAQIKIVTSPSNSLTYDGELLQKNNIFWITTQGTKWHLALDGEFDESLTYDNSVKGPDIIYQGNSNDCPYCNGAGKRKCSSCDGTGSVYASGTFFGTGLFDGWIQCGSCYGTGVVDCKDCKGTGKKIR